MEITELLDKHLEELSYLQGLVTSKERHIKEVCRVFSPEDFQNVDYDYMKELREKIIKYMNFEEGTMFDKVMMEKKKIKYPELNRATYFPQINKLDVSDEEKYRLDRELYKVNGYFFEEDLLKRSNVNLSVENIQKLCKLGVVKKYVCFIHNGECVGTFSGEQINGLKEIWHFYNTDPSELSSEECDRWDELEKKYGSTIYLSDDDWENEFSYEISSLEDYDNYEWKKEKYRVCVAPNTKYDSL